MEWYVNNISNVIGHSEKKEPTVSLYSLIFLYLLVSVAIVASGRQFACKKKIRKIFSPNKIKSKHSFKIIILGSPPGKRSGNNK